LQKLKKYYLSKCYSSIDELPIYYWDKIIETHNVAFLLKKNYKQMNVKRVNALSEYVLIQYWNGIQNDYINRFGFSESFLEIFRKEKQIAKLTAKLIISGDATVQTFINIAKFEADQLRNKNLRKMDIYETKTQLEKLMGFKINMFETTVAEFFGYINSAEKINQQHTNG